MKVSGPKLIKIISAPADGTVESGKHPGRICYVDDSRTSAYVTKKILTEFGYTVEHFGSAEPAIVALLEKDYDLLLTDLLISAGGMNGDDLVRFLRMSGHPRKKLLPVIVITGTSDKDTLLKIYEAGANGVLVKPITGEELNERIRSLLPEQRASATDSGYALEIRDKPQSATKPEAHRAPAEASPVKIAKPLKPRRPAPPMDEVVDADVQEALEAQQRMQRIDEIELPHASKRPVTAFGAKKRPTQPEAERDAASVIAELRARPHEHDEEDIPTLTLALDLSEPVVPAESIHFDEGITLHAAAPEPAASPPVVEEELSLVLHDTPSPPPAAPSRKPAPAAAAPKHDVQGLIEPAELPTDGKTIITALDIEQDFQDIQADEFGQPSITQTLVETIKHYKVLSAAALASLLIIGWSLFNFMSTGGSVVVETVHAESGSLHQSINVPGKVASKLKVDLSAGSSGQVRQLLAKEGDKVRKGQTLAVLENEELASEVKRSEGNLISAQEESTLAEKTVTRMRRALELGAVSRQALEEAEAALKSAKAREAVAKENVRGSRALSEKLTVTAPFEGTVTAKQIQVGQYIKVSDVMFSIVDLGQREIEAKVDAADSASIQVGQQVDVSSDAYPDRKWTEAVTHVATSANRDNASNTVNVFISLGREAPALKVGQQVDAEIRIASSENAIKVPIGALMQRNGKTWVGIIEDGRVHFVPVEVGMEDMTHVEITEGLRRGQEIILPKGANLREGDRVTVVASRKE